MSTTTEAPTKRYAVQPMEGVDVFRVGNEAVITIQPATGFVSVTCPWHPEVNGSHYWTHRGSETIYQFIAGMGRSYACGKLFGSQQTEEFDLEATQADVRKWIIESRRDGSMKPREARDLWDEVETCGTQDDVCRLSMDEPWYHLQHRDKPCFDWFWDSVWSSFIEHVKERHL